MLNVFLENDVKDKQGIYEGVYIFQGFIEGIDYWVDTEGVNVLFYMASWKFAPMQYLGSSASAIHSTSNILKKSCPNNEGYVWNWRYADLSTYSWITTSNVYVKCANEDDFCTSQNPCGTDQGDCDTHDECQDGLACGSNNCPDSLGFHSELDCCYSPIVGDKHFCTNANPCAVDEGDCEFNNECQATLICDTANSCPAYLEFASDVNCCSIGSGCESYDSYF